MKHLVISIHDFTHHYGSELEDILEEFNVRSLKKRTILVVPNLNQQFPISQSLSMLYSLNSEKDLGNEICLHGYDHHEFRHYKEFDPLSYYLAKIKIKEGKKELNKLGITSIDGFVAPYWKISKESEKAVKDEGFIFSAKNPQLLDLRNNKSYSSRPIWYWPYNWLLGSGFKVFNSFLANSWNNDNDLIRVAVHPQDVHGKGKPFEHALKIIGYLQKKGFELSSYKNYLDFKKNAGSFDK
ncbi:MAG: DUF2334 domain-containing protein [Nanoarchaeota archaeon]|nr:DUF2334 domain-containing protein [Nanoarchaeota archaeon]MBU1631899.1 DUF2334 domain-containing protein [Nanoarchaeota archaeon]MBU1875914.1 DUF2334 domain-containing protein [Nanoarchaeota archaeon]